MEPVIVEAVPVVFWFRVGTSEAWMFDMVTFVPSPRKYLPLVTAPALAFTASCWVVAPVPPFAIATVPVTFEDVPLMLPEIVELNVFVPATVSLPVRCTTLLSLALPARSLVRFVTCDSPIEPVIVEAVPVVFWLSVGTSPAWIDESVVCVPSLRRYVPELCVPASASIAPCWVIAPVPPLAIATVPVTFEDVPLMLPLIVELKVFVPATVSLPVVCTTPLS